MYVCMYVCTYVCIWTNTVLLTTAIKNKYAHTYPYNINVYNIHTYFIHDIYISWYILVYVCTYIFHIYTYIDQDIRTMKCVSYTRCMVVRTRTHSTWSVGYKCDRERRGSLPQ